MKRAAVFLVGFPQRNFLYVGDQAAEPAIVALAVRQQQIFMPGMKFYQRAGGLRPRQGFLPTMIGEDPIDKILAQRGIIQAAFFFDRHQRKSGHDRGGE